MRRRQLQTWLNLVSKERHSEGKEKRGEEGWQAGRQGAREGGEASRKPSLRNSDASSAQHCHHSVRSSLQTNGPFGGTEKPPWVHYPSWQCPVLCLSSKCPSLGEHRVFNPLPIVDVEGIRVAVYNGSAVICWPLVLGFGQDCQQMQRQSLRSVVKLMKRMNKPINFFSLIFIVPEASFIPRWAHG